MSNTKIATCCYCGTRAALVLKGAQSHELACASCGAPLHDLKKLRTASVDATAHQPARKGKKGARKSVQSPMDLMEIALRKSVKRPKRKKRKGLLHEAFDLIEDIFD
ncbi:hypothetical protein [Sagittula sp. SSi028]|uniref:hypothetical protein n=1 Tax=Sagittula sp. SSi028 TaxID=3400636 RepID=UPI003AF98EDC